MTERDETLREDGYLLLEAARAALAAISANYHQLNALNVFPVPDGDTGTNMMLTLRSIHEDMTRSATAEVSVTAEKMSRAALLGARGNSGLIMAQFYRGLHNALSDAENVSGQSFAAGLIEASKLAYTAVPQPKEGTMLTVLRESSEAAWSAASEGDSTLLSVVAAAAEQAMDTVERTPEMLDVLKEAGVVDSGGFGFAIMLIGIERLLKGEEEIDAVIEAPSVAGGKAPSDITAAVAGNIAGDFVDAVEEEAWGYCTVFAIEGEGLDVDALREQMEKIGRSPVVAGDEKLVKVHVHMEDPGQALSAGILLGSLSNIDIHNMDEQAARWAEDRRAESDMSEASSSGSIESEDDAETPSSLDMAVIAVAVGSGICDYFRELGSGACFLVEGGDSMNPSVADLLSQIESAPSENVILLPNNKNILGVARQAAEVSEKQVIVVPTLSVQAGIAAMYGFDPDGSLEENVDGMSEMVEDLHIGSVFRASRDASFGGVKVREGELMVTVDSDAIAAGEDSAEMLIAGVRSVMHHGASVFVYWGDDIDKTSADEAEARLVSSLGEFQRVDIHFVEGNQPHYPFLFSVE